MKKETELATFTLDPDKKDYITRSTLEKMIKEIRSHLVKNKRVLVVLKDGIDVQCNDCLHCNIT